MSKSEKIIKKIITCIVISLVIASMFSCKTSKYGCPMVQGTVGHGAVYIKGK